MSGTFEDEDDYWNAKPGVRNVYSFDEESSILDSSGGTNLVYTSSDATHLARPPSSSKTTETDKKILDKPALTPSMITCNPIGSHEILVRLSNMNLTGRTRDDILTAKILDPKITVRNIVERGGPIELSHFRSRKDKILLLENALLYSHGDLIIATVLFMRRTLKRSIFIEELKKRPIAISHYLNYLEEHGDFNDLVEFLNIIGRHEDALMMEFYQTLRTVNVQKRINKLKSLNKEIKSKYQRNSQAATLATLIESHMKLLEKKQLEGASPSNSRPNTKDNDAQNSDHKSGNAAVNALAVESHSKIVRPLQYIFSNKPFF